MSSPRTARSPADGSVLGVGRVPYDALGASPVAPPVRLIYYPSMTAVEQVVQIPFFQGLPAEALRKSPQNRTILTLERGETFISQHAAAEHVFFLISGSVQFYIHFHGVDDLLVGTMRAAGGSARLVGFSQAPSLHRDGPMRRGMPGVAATT